MSNNIDYDKIILYEQELAKINDKELETYLSDDALKDFLRTIKNHKIPTNEENIELCKKAQNGDITSRNLLIEHNLRLVVAVAFRDKHKLKCYEKLDVIQDGILGLIKGIEKFDVSKGYYFSTYVIYWIKQTIGRGIDNNDNNIRIPTYLKLKIIKYKQIKEEYLRNKIPLPTDIEWLEILDISEDTLKNIQETAKLNIDSLNRLVENPEDNDYNIELSNFIQIEDTNYNILLNNIVDNELKLFLKLVLEPQHYYVLYHLILSNDRKTLKFLAAKFHITHQRISQMENQSLAKIRRYYRNKTFSISKYLKEKNINNVDDYCLEPINPSNIIKYLYVKDYLTKEEKIVLQTYFFNIEKNYLITISQLLNLDNEDTKILLANTLEKVKEILIQEDISFQEFSNNLIKEYGVRIFKIDLNIENKNLFRVRKVTSQSKNT